MHMVKKKINVFVSSSMKDEDSKELRLAVKSFFERSLLLYNCYIIEDYASPDKINKRCENCVRDADIIVMILKKEYRQGVHDEFLAAKRFNKRIFAFIHNGKKDRALTNFIEEIRENVSSANFSDIYDLINKIEGSLLENLVSVYKLNLEVENNGKDKVIFK